MPDPIITASLTPPVITQGQNSTLTWSCTNTVSLTLNGDSVATSGTEIVNPSTTTTYTFVATGSGYSPPVVTRTLTLTVNPMALARFDTWVRSAVGPAAAGTQVYVCTQPATIGVPPSPLALLYSDSAGAHPVTQPLVADGFGHASAYCSAGSYTVVVVYGGRVQQTYPDQLIGGTAGTSFVLQTDGVPNPVQSLLNLKSGSGITLAADGLGGVTINNTAITSAGGVDTNLQFNQSGSFAGDDALIWDYNDSFGAIPSLIVGDHSVLPSGYSASRLQVPDTLDAALLGSSAQTYAAIQTIQQVNLTGDQTGWAFTCFDTSTSFNSTANYGFVYLIDLNFSHLGSGSIANIDGVYAALNTSTTGATTRIVGFETSIALNANTTQAEGLVIAAAQNFTGTCVTFTGVDITTGTAGPGSNYTTIYGMKLHSPSGAGTISNYYGIYIEDPTAFDAPTLSYAIYIAGGKFHCGGALEDSTNSVGTSGYILTSTVTGVAWAPNVAAPVTGAPIILEMGWPRNDGTASSDTPFYPGGSSWGQFNPSAVGPCFLQFAPAAGILQKCNSWTVQVYQGFNLASFSFQMQIVKVARGQKTVLATTNVTFGGLATPSFSGGNPTMRTSDTINFAIDPNFDYYFIVQQITGLPYLGALSSSGAFPFGGVAVVTNQNYGVTVSSDLDFTGYSPEASNSFLASWRVVS